MLTIVYSDKYYCNIGNHVFPSRKYRLVYEMLEREKKLSGKDVKLLEPRIPTQEELRLVHTEEYLHAALNARVTWATFSSELPIRPDIIEAFLLNTGGTLVASESALETGRSINLGGGFHHAFPDHAEGFCFFNDIAIAIRKILSEQKASRVAIVDCDLHQGNGTAYIFSVEERVFAFSIHQENNYPVKQKSTLDIGLDDGVGDEEYLKKLQGALEQIDKEFKPDYLFYVAGADPFKDDQLGGLKLTLEGFRRRDDAVIGFAERNNIPVCVTLAGGYARDVLDTIRIHYQTCVRLLDESER